MFFLIAAGATEIFDMPDLEIPHTLVINGNKIYVGGKSKVYIYKSPNHLEKIFGKQGEGPGEFREFFDLGLYITISPSNIIVSSNGKLSFFDLKANFLKEIKTGSGYSYTPVKDNFVAIRFSNDDGVLKRNIALVNNNRQVIKNLVKKNHWYQQGKKIDPVNVRNPRYCMMNNLVYAENAKSGEIYIFNAKGEKLGTALSEYPQVKVTAADQKEYHKYYKNHRYYKSNYAQLKHLIEFPKYYPPIKFFDCADDRIYVMSHLRIKGANEIYIFDKSGKFLRKLMVKMEDIVPQELLPLIRIANGKIYQLFEDADDEIWKLHITKIPIK
jgi:hypothetical protein